MGAAAEAAANAWTAAAATPRAAVYIGDGMSVGDQLQSADLEQLSRKLVEARSSALELRHRSANRRSTCSARWPIIRAACWESTARRSRLVPPVSGWPAWLTHAVFWPKTAQWPAGLTEVLPKTLPPLRADRDSVVLGVGSLTEPAQVKWEAEVGGKPVSLAWTRGPGQCQ